MSQITSRIRQAVLGTWFDSLSLREQSLVAAVAIVLALAVAYIGVWQPTWEFYSNSVRSYSEELGKWAWMQQNARRIDGSESSNGSRPEARRMTTLTQSARQAGITIQRFLESNDDSIRIELREADFEKTLNWLVTIRRQHNFQIIQLRFDRIGSGQVNVEATVV